MGSVLKHTVFNAGTTQGIAVPANLGRKNLLIMDKHASQTLKVKFGSAIVGSDVTQIQTLSFSSVPTAGSLVLRWNGNNSAAIVSTDAASDVQTKLRAVTGLSSVTVSGDFTGFIITLTGVTPLFFATDPVLTIFSNTLNIAAVTEVQHLDFDAIPDAGSFKIHAGSANTALILFSDNAAAVQTKLQAVSGYGSVTVAGDFTAGFDVTFTGLTGPQSLLTTNTNTLTTTATPVVITVSETTAGVSAATTTPSIAITTPGQFADGYFVAAANGSLAFTGDSCPGDAIYILASGANTRVEIVEGF